ncbi:RRM protein [Ceratobasidium sp. 414]|nr:RRM protein [Ceratobasidium sp. 414]
MEEGAENPAPTVWAWDRVESAGALQNGSVGEMGIVGDNGGFHREGSPSGPAMERHPVIFVSLRTCCIGDQCRNRKARARQRAHCVDAIAALDAHSRANNARQCARARGSRGVDRVTRVTEYPTDRHRQPGGVPSRQGGRRGRGRRRRAGRTRPLSGKLRLSGDQLPRGFANWADYVSCVLRSTTMAQVSAVYISPRCAHALHSGPTMQPARVSRPYPLSPPPPSVSPLAASKPATLSPPGANHVWSDRLSLDTSDEGTSRFFSSSTSSAGSANSAGSRSPPRWPAQPQLQKPKAQSLLRSYPPPMFLAHDNTADFHVPAAERELHVVLPEPWMDAPYVLQMARTQGWDVLDVRMQPHGAVLVFASAAGAARAFAQVNGSPEGVSWIGAGAARVQAHWAGAVGRANEEEMQTFAPARPLGSSGGPNSAKQLEFSIFVGDLAPETTNADLVAVFRNPLLGLRSDREPRVIRPFTSCRSAKIMVSPETGISKGYGFVRFTDEADQQRALIEMQGLYCLSRPMRLSHATAKTKPITAANGGSAGFSQYGDELDPFLLNPAGAGHGHETYARPGPDLYGSGSGRHSVSGPSDLVHYPRRGDYTAPPRARSIDAEEFFSTEAGGRVLGVEGGRVLGLEGARGGIGLSEDARLESARALLGVLNSADPYNTTVFVGGLSGLIAEETLRGFFAPFGEIHYVKIPPGKGCGFVQFVRKADAERAIERMQGFPIGGGKIRLSWGRSQSDKAAQAAAQAVQLGLNLGGLHLNSLSVADSARLFQTLEALGYSSVPSGGLQTNGFQVQDAQYTGGFQGQQLGGFQGQPFQAQQATNFQGPPASAGLQGPNAFQFSPTQPQTFQTNPSPPAQSPLAGQFAHPLYEAGSAGMSRAYTTSGFQPFSSDLAPGYGRGAPNRQSLPFESESFGLVGGRERQQTAPANSSTKSLNLGLAGLGLGQRREFGLDVGPLSAPLYNGIHPGGNGGGTKPTLSDNTVYLH